MNLSLPTIVRILAELERSLGVLLFNRTTRRLSITDEGQIYLEHCRKILSDVRDAEQAMSRSQIEPAGSLTVTAPVRFGELHIAPLVVSYLLAYPKTVVKLLLLDRLVNLVEEGIDVAVRIAPLEDSALMARRAGSIRQVIAASPAFLARHGVPGHPSDLTRQSCVLAANIGEQDSWEFSESGQPFLVRIDGRLHCNNVGAGLAACIAGLGFGRFLQYQVAEAVARGQLQLVLEAFEPPPRPLSLVYAANRLGNIRVGSFVEMAVGALRAEFDRPRV
jgi:DNA-binding transcriptional LysR family regulator